MDKGHAAKIAFIDKLMPVSGALAIWAQDKMFIDKWSIEDVKLAIREAAKICGEEI